VSPELFAEIKMQMDERGNAPQQTDVVTLNAELLEVTTEGNRHIASVHFSGMIREVAGAAAAPFNEIWNLSKPTEGAQGWIIAGIQQVN
jgi:predicted lipid-binding transport protein (Tim44 family)